MAPEKSTETTTRPIWHGAETFCLRGEVRDAGAGRQEEDDKDKKRGDVREGVTEGNRGR